MKDSVKIAIGIFLGLSATCLCAICVLLILSGSGVALLDSVIRDVLSTETAMYSKPTWKYTVPFSTKVSPSKTIDKNLLMMKLSQYDLSVFYDPDIWTLTVDQYKFGTLTNKSLIECQLRDAGIGEVLGDFKEAIKLGDYSFYVFERLGNDGRIIREYLVVLGPGITSTSGKPYIILSVPPFNTKTCIDEANIVLSTLGEQNN
jgi:hypothetical protein